MSTLSPAWSFETIQDVVENHIATHSRPTPQEQTRSGVAPGLVRLSVGIEHVDDILAAVELGFVTATSALDG